MAIWKKEPGLEYLNKMSTGILSELDIRFTEIGDDYLSAEMEVVPKTHQPFGVLHGGVSVVLAESVGSTASFLMLPEGKTAVGLEVNANHVRSVRSGIVTATSRLLHFGKMTHVWDIQIVNERNQLFCVSRLTMAVIDIE